MAEIRLFLRLTAYWDFAIMDSVAQKTGHLKTAYPAEGQVNGMGGCNSKADAIIIMVDPLPSLLSLKESYEKLDKIRKNHIKLSAVILTVSMGLILYFLPQREVFAQKPEMRIVLTSETVDPLHKIGQGIENKRANNFSQNKAVERAEEKEEAENPIFHEMLDGFPMEKMIPALNKRDKEVASYLIAIAKKESDWGKHSPKKSGKECFNYWGYKGSYNQTVSGYSCFDSPEDAVSAVGDRIEKLLGKNIDTPEKLVVWKCGSSCSGHAPDDVRKWIQDVAKYYNKINKG